MLMDKTCKTKYIVTDIFKYLVTCSNYILNKQFITQGLN